MRNFSLAFVILSTVSASALADTTKPSANTPASLEVTSTAFANNQAIPTDYTCEGTDSATATAPPLAWSKVPAATKSIAILVDDPDAPKGTFTHWLVTNIPATTTSITGSLPRGAIAAKNDKGATGYAAPCPPSGLHHYHFRVYALDVSLPEAMTRAEFLSAARGHILATGQLVGTYQKRTSR